MIAALPMDAKVSAVISNSRWSWPAARSKALVSIQAGLCDLLPNSNASDVIQRILSPKGDFSIKGAWSYLGEKKARVDWFKLLWGSLCITRFSFIAWLSVLK